MHSNSPKIGEIQRRRNVVLIFSRLDSGLKGPGLSAIRGIYGEFLRKAQKGPLYQGERLYSFPSKDSSNALGHFMQQKSR